MAAESGLDTRLKLRESPSERVIRDAIFANDHQVIYNGSIAICLTTGIVKPEIVPIMYFRECRRPRNSRK